MSSRWKAERGILRAKDRVMNKKSWPGFTVKAVRKDTQNGRPLTLLNIASRSCCVFDKSFKEEDEEKESEKTPLEGS